MSKKINKIVDNYPVLLNSEEKDNLVKTLSSVILEVAPGGTGGKIYTGAEGVYVDNDNNRITLESTAKNAIDNIPHTVGELTDSANYQTVAGMSNYLTTATYQTDSATFLTQTSASQNLAPISVTGDIETLKSSSGAWNKVNDKLDTTAFSNVSGNFLTAHQSLTNYYTKDETSGASELSDEFAKYVTSSNVTTQDTDYVMTTTGWKVLTLPGGGMTQVTHDETLTGQGNADDSKLGVAWSALSGNTIYSAIKANSASAAKRLQESTAGPSIQVGDVTALQNWASSNSSTWDSVTAKLGTAQYANDSATFVTSSSDTITGTKQYALTTAGWSNIGLDDYVPYSATKLAIGSNNDISESNSNNSFAQGTNNKVSTSPDSFVQGEANSAVNYYSLAQGYGNYAQDHSLAQGTTNNAITLSLVQGQNNTARSYSIAQGTQNSADTTAFAQGSANKARYDSFAQGNRNSAYSHSFAQGSMNYADNNALAQGGNNTAKYFSQALGFGLSIQGSRGVTDDTDYISGGLAIGTYNQTSAGVAFVVGNGHSNGSEDPTRSDAFIIYHDGRVSAAGNISANGVELGAGGGSLTLPVNVGTGNDVSQTSAIGAIGNNCSAGTKSFAFSYKGATAYDNSFAVNDDNVAGHNSFAWGWANTADNYSMAGGNATSADEHSFALGNAVYTKYWTLGIGRGLEFSGDSNSNTGIGAIVAGGWNKTTSNAIFVLGNGTNNGSYRSDAVVVDRSGNTSATEFSTFDNKHKLTEKVSTTDSPHGSNLKAEMSVIVFSDNEIVNFVTGGSCSGKGTLFFRVE